MPRSSWGGCAHGESPHDWLYAPRMDAGWGTKPKEPRDKSINDHHHKDTSVSHGYRWLYGLALYNGFRTLSFWSGGGEEPTRKRRRARLLRFYTRDWLDRCDPKLGATFRFTGPFTRYCQCHGAPLDDEDELICPITQMTVERWDVVDAKGRIVCSVLTAWGTDHVSFPEEVVFVGLGLAAESS